ncbi:MAG: hypothetical protein QOE90_924 [Thermoplasmata archaeon]|jgi:hypothetical protein|nr:hypothetical protein [Thermoplasmata archaeon]
MTEDMPDGRLLYKPTDSGDLSAGGAGTRALTTVYQNLSGRTLLVMVRTSKNTGAAASTQTTAFCDANPAPATIVDTDLQTNFGAIAAVLAERVSFLVPPGAYYEVSGTVGLVLGAWHEWTFG